MSNKIYYPWIDWAKFFGIYLVILGHGWLLDESWKLFLYSFHMPFFFLLSGILFKFRPLPQLLKNDWHRLMIPYLLMNLFFLLRSLIRPILSGTITLEYVYSRVGAIILGSGYPTHGFIPVCDTCWFIIALFIMHILTVKCRVNNKTWLNWIIMFVFPLLAVLLRVIGFNFFTSLNSALLAIPFFYIGIGIQSYIERIGRKDNLVLRLAIGGGLLFLTCLLSRMNGRVDVDLCIWGNNIALFYLIALLGSAGMILICSIFNKEVFVVRTISKGTIFILGFNLYFIELCKILVKYVPNYVHSNLGGCMWGLFILFVSFFLILFLQRYFSIMLGNRK